MAGVLVVAAWTVVVAPRIVYGLNSDIPTGSIHKMWESFFANAFYSRVYFSDEQLFRLMDPLRIGHNELFFEPFLYASLLLRGLVRSLLVFHSPFFSGSEHFVETGLAGGLGGAVFYTLGLAGAIRGWSHTRFGILLLWFGSGVFFLSVINTFPPRHTHLVAVIPVAAIFVAVGIVAAVEALSTSLKLGPVAGGIVVPLLLVLSVVTLGCAAWQHYFERINKAYPANFEQAVSWVAWRIENEEVTLAYIEPTPQHHDVAYLVWAQMIPQDYKNLATADLFRDDNPLSAVEQLVAFFPEDESGNVAARLRQTVANAGPPVALSDKDGRTLGYAITNSAIDLNPTLTFGGGLRSLTHSPLWKVLLLPTLGLVFVLLLAWRAK
jgi:hypothetical protein